MPRAALALLSLRVSCAAFPEIAVDQFPDGMGRKGPPVPLTFVSGFLGSGKTTMLKHVLENKEGRRVGVVVNDVAEVNIDAKLLARAQMADEDNEYEDTVELENGCACCTAGPDLMDSILKLIRLSIRRDITYDRIVVEMSGVAEPRNLRDDFQDSRESHQVFKYVELQTMLTVVDSSHFLELYSSKTHIKQELQLVMNETVEPSQEVCIDSNRRVVDLLVEMIECADYVVLNKTDRVSPTHQNQLKDIAQSLNPAGTCVPCEWGKVNLDVVLGAPKGTGVCNVDDHLKEDIKRAVQSSRKGKRVVDSLGEGVEASVFGDVAFSQRVPGAVERNRQVAGPQEMPSPVKRRKGDEGSLSPSRKGLLSVRQQTSAADRFGISTFVYSRRRPFHPKRLVEVLKLLPVQVDDSGKAIDTWALPASLAAQSGKSGPEVGVEASQGAEDATGSRTGKQVMHAVIRSKGFVWLANLPKTMHYWSHAGHFFSLEPLHEWSVQCGSPLRLVPVQNSYVLCFRCVPDPCACATGGYRLRWMNGLQNPIILQRFLTILLGQRVRKRRLEQ